MSTNFFTIPISSLEKYIVEVKQKQLDDVYFNVLLGFGLDPIDKPTYNQEILTIDLVNAFLDAKVISLTDLYDFDKNLFAQSLKHVYQYQKEHLVNKIKNNKTLLSLKDKICQSNLITRKNKETNLSSLFLHKIQNNLSDYEITLEQKSSSIFVSSKFSQQWLRDFDFVFFDKKTLDKVFTFSLNQASIDEQDFISAVMLHLDKERCKTFQCNLDELVVLKFSIENDLVSASTSEGDFQFYLDVPHFVYNNTYSIMVYDELNEKLQKLFKEKFEL